MEYQWIRAWWTCVELTVPELTGRGSSAQAAVLTALGNAAQKAGTRVIAFGIRSLELAAGCDHTTVARALRALRDSPDPLIDLVQTAHGSDADTYQLRIPDRLATVARTRTWRRGPIRAVHLVFRILGLPAWQTHTALTESPGTVTELADRTGLSRTATHTALQALADHGLARSAGRTWHPGPQTLDRVGRHLAADTLTDTIHAGHRADRAAWRDYLSGLHRLARVNTLADIITNNQPWSGPDPGAPPPRGPTSSAPAGSDGPQTPGDDRSHPDTDTPTSPAHAHGARATGDPTPAPDRDSESDSGSDRAVVSPSDWYATVSWHWPDASPLDPLWTEEPPPDPFGTRPAGPQSHGGPHINQQAADQAALQLLMDLLGATPTPGTLER